MLYKQYYQKASRIINEAYLEEGQKICQGARIMADCIGNGDLIYAFGCGHSHMLAEEMFYRAGGLVPVSAMLMEDVMLHNGALRSSIMERKEGLTPALLDTYGVTSKDVLLVISTSGINSASVDVALEARKRGIYVIGITSLAYRDEPANHSSGKRLCEVCDLYIDNHVPVGDAIIPLDGNELSVGPISTLVSVMLVECLVVQTVEELMKKGIEPPVYCSGNVVGGLEKNIHQVIAKRDRIKLLDPTGEALK